LDSDMIDLSSKSHEQGQDGKKASVAPQHDPVHGESISGEARPSRWHFPHERMEAGIQRISRWAGPLALIATLLLLGWWTIA